MCARLDILMASIRYFAGLYVTPDALELINGMS